VHRARPGNDSSSPRAGFGYSGGIVTKSGAGVATTSRERSAPTAIRCGPINCRYGIMTYVAETQEKAEANSSTE